MAGMAAKVVEAFFEAQDTKPTVINDSLLRVGWNFEGGSISIFFDFDEDDAHVHLEGLEYITVPADKYDKIYPVLNEVNGQYRLVKFVLDTDNGSICAKLDAVIQLDSCGPECFELMIRMVKIVEGAYPVFMKALWA